MENERISSRLKHAWNAFLSKDPTQRYSMSVGASTGMRPDRRLTMMNSDRSVVQTMYNRMSIDVSMVTIRHVRNDENDRYLENYDSSLDKCLSVSANVDQTGRALVQDIVMSMFDEGVVAVVPVDTTFDPRVTGSYDIKTLRVGRVTQWMPRHIEVSLYNEITGLREEVILPKSTVAIIENPLYAVMNEPNSTLKRLIRKLNLLDSLDEKQNSGKLDIIIQLPYAIKSDMRRQQAEDRRKAIEMQLTGSTYGIAYIDGTEKVTQLNRPAENNLLVQIESLTSMLYSQLGLTEGVFNGTADEKEMLNYHNRTVEPILSAITEEMERKFLTETARTQRQAITYFRDPFKLVPVSELADIADKFTRNEILSSNEVRGIIGFKPAKDPAADELRNKNLNTSKDADVEVNDKPEEKEEESNQNGSI